MSFFYVTNEWADPNVYFNVAKAMLNGKVLYTEIFDHKGPFIFFIYGLGYLISNDSFFGMFLIQIVCWILGMCSAYFCARLFLSKSASFFTALITAVFFMKLMKAGGSVEEFVLHFEIISIYLILRYFVAVGKPRHNPKHMFIHGLLFSIVLFSKINLVIFWVFPLMGIFINLILYREYKNIAYNILSFLLGFILIAIPVVGYLYTNDALAEAYDVYIELNRSYAKLPVTGVIMALLSNLLFLFIEPVSLVVLFPLGVFLFARKLLVSKISKWSITLCGVSLYLSIFSSTTFQTYYPIPLVVFAMLGVIVLFCLLGKYVHVEFSIRTLSKLMLVFVFITLTMRPLLSNTRIEKWVLGDKAITSTVLTHKLADEIKKEENPTLLNVGFGLGNNLFTTCNIIPSVKYFVRPNLTYKMYPKLRDEQERYIEEKKTQFVVVPSYVYEKVSVMLTDLENSTGYYLKLPSFQKNYEFVLADTIVNTVDGFNTVEIYRLFRRVED